MDYTFMTLNDKDFELLALDLLNAKFKLNLQAFKIGKDKGIDLRYSSPKNNNEIVVQAKHYADSKYAQLKHTLKKVELDKIKKLLPQRYIVVTSLALSTTEKDELKLLLQPFVLSSNDIITRTEINSYLREFPEIEKSFFKLWFSSTSVLMGILNNAIEGRTRYHLESVAKKMKNYVITKKLDEANTILQKEKLLLITGQPGIGKTTLADILLFEKAKSSFKIYKVENILEAEEVFSFNNNEKQLFYFDDFLGANYLEILNAHKTETQLTSFVERVKNTPNKYLILTTRTVILNHAIENYEKIGQSNIGKKQFELKLTDYTKYEKALILYNNLFFRSIRDDLHNAIIEDSFYLKIINHRNYVPRIIEFITDKSKIDNFDVVVYRQFILNNLNNPSEIWRYSFTKQIGNSDRCFLLTLFTFQGEISEQYLMHAFEERLKYEISINNQPITSNQFLDTIRILLNGFVISKIETNKDGNKILRTRKYSFINPSLSDFIIGYLSNSYQERKSIISSIAYVEQLKVFELENKIIPLEKDLQLLIRTKVIENKLNAIDTVTKNQKISMYIATLYKYCNQIEIDTVILSLLERNGFYTN